MRQEASPELGAKDKSDAVETKMQIILADVDLSL